ncbi:MAG: DUF4168 domain-containing protein [Spirochaetota bacterium]
MVVAFLLVAMTLVAQNGSEEEVSHSSESASPEELADFAVAYLEVRVLRTQVNEEVDAMIGRSELPRERFSAIADTGTEDLPDDEAQAYRDVRESIEAAGQAFRRRAAVAIEEAGLSVDRFAEINRGLNADPDLAERARAQIEQIVADRADTVGIDVEREDHSE